MINNIDEAISHAREKAEEQKKKAESNIIETTKEGWIRLYDGKEYNDCLECASEHEQLAEWLTELKERREADRWIPVSEKLPEKDGAFLICTPSGLIETSVFTFGQFTRPYVIAWKHLPEPYDWRTENE